MYRDELAIENGILLKSGWIIIPKSMQPEIFKKFTMAIKELRNVSYKLKAEYSGATSVRILTELYKAGIFVKNNRKPNVQNP